MKKIALIMLTALVLAACGGNDIFTVKEKDTDTESEVTEEAGRVSGGKVEYAVNFDPSKWTVQKSEVNLDAEYEFEHVDGDVYAMIIPERIEIPLDTLKEIAVENAQLVASDEIEVFEEGEVTIGDYKGLMMSFGATIEGIPFQYYSYYISGEFGSIQFVSYSTPKLVEDYLVDIQELLSGLEITAASEVDSE